MHVEKANGPLSSLFFLRFQSDHASRQQKPKTQKPKKKSGRDTRVYSKTFLKKKRKPGSEKEKKKKGSRPTLWRFFGSWKKSERLKTVRQMLLCVYMRMRPRLGEWAPIYSRQTDRAKTGENTVWETASDSFAKGACKKKERKSQTKTALVSFFSFFFLLVPMKWGSKRAGDEARGLSDCAQTLGPGRHEKKTCRCCTIDLARPKRRVCVSHCFFFFFCEQVARHTCRCRRVYTILERPLFPFLTLFPFLFCFACKQRAQRKEYAVRAPKRILKNGPL